MATPPPASQSIADDDDADTVPYVENFDASSQVTKAYLVL